MSMMIRRNIKRRAVKNTAPLIKKNEIIEEKNVFNYTKTDVNRMPIAELKQVAEEFEIENADSLTGADIKKALIEKFGL